MKTPKTRSLLLLVLLLCIAITLLAIREKIEEAPPDETEDHSHAAETLLEEALLLEREGKWDEAIRIHETVIRDFKDDGHGHGEGYGGFAEESIRKLNCLKRRGPNFKTPTLHALNRLVTESLKAGDPAALTRYAACGFITGMMESDDISSDDPEKAIPEIVRSAKEITWKPLQEAQLEESVLLESQSGEMALVFSKEGEGWVWNGFLKKL